MKFPMILGPPPLPECSKGGYKILDYADRNYQFKSNNVSIGFCDDSSIATSELKWSKKSPDWQGPGWYRTFKIN